MFLLLTTCFATDVCNRYSWRDVHPDWSHLPPLPLDDVMDVNMDVNPIIQSKYSPTFTFGVPTPPTPGFGSPPFPMLLGSRGSPLEPTFQPRYAESPSDLVFAYPEDPCALSVKETVKGEITRVKLTQPIRDQLRLNATNLETLYRSLSTMIEFITKEQGSDAVYRRPRRSDPTGKKPDNFRVTGDNEVTYCSFWTSIVLKNFDGLLEDINRVAQKAWRCAHQPTFIPLHELEKVRSDAAELIEHATASSEILKMKILENVYWESRHIIQRAQRESINKIFHAD